MNAMTDLRSLGNRLTTLAQWQLCKTALDDFSFAEAPASASHHPGPHQERGGLVLHTWEVAKAAVDLAGRDGKLAQLAYVAAVFHDYGKIHEYDFVDDKVVKTDFYKMTGHIAYSWRYFLDQNRQLSLLDHSDEEEIAHAILAHHGRREWGSPVEPATRLAFILHTADMLSSRGITK